MKETTKKIVFKEDQSFDQDHYNFDFLKSEGLKHIGDLSGKIWTDHNAHDPGVTILEMLIYALMDLGYRTQLPIQDLLATPDQSSNNYFSPAQILTNNPTTVLDYRKLLIAIDGVRNAWLEPNLEDKYFLNCYNKSSDDDNDNDNDNDNEPPVLLNIISAEDVAAIVVEVPQTKDCSQEKYWLDCTAKNKKDEFNCLPIEFNLNGLYSVCIQKEPNLSLEAELALKNKVLDTLHKHRNLCEDFVEVKILCEEEIGICADISIHEAHDPEEVYVCVILAIEQFLSPNITFYTLQEMLEEKGKLIEEVFEGRPFDPDYNSPGFIDVEELENIPLRKEIHLSDLYGMISALEGVESVRDITISTTLAKENVGGGDVDCKDWIFNLSQDHVPVFSPEKSCLTLSRDGAFFKLDAFAIQRIKSQNLKTRTSGRAIGNKSYLDIEPPNGTYRSDLGDYYSIQNEFPSVYGIGEGGLPETASKKRQAQALQLKGYLLFFDQLLVNYLEQLTNAKNLFSFDNVVQEISQNGSLDSVPDLERILQFYNSDSQDSVTLLPIKKSDFFTIVRPGLINRNPIEYNFNGEKYATGNKLSRDVQIEQLTREFGQENYAIDIYPTENCFYFVIQPDSLSIVLLAKAIFNTEEEAKIAANNISFVGSKEENYQHVDKPSEQKYSFELLFSPSKDNASLVEELVETDQSKLDRKNLFLDHLLARFSESFTSYSLLIYDQMKDRLKASRHLIDTKANFLSNYPELSSNRGTGFDYRNKDLVFDASNVSGLEKRFYALTGQGKPQKKYLCNFEVHQYKQEFQVVFKFGNKTFFKTKNTYDSFEEGIKVCRIIFEEAKQNQFYSREDKKDCFLILFNSSKIIEPLSFETKEDRDNCFYAIRNLLHVEPSDDFSNIYPSKSIYHLELKTSKGEVVARSKDGHSDETTALFKEKQFVNNIKKQTSLGDYNLSSLKLLSQRVNDKRISIDKAFTDKHVKVADSEYRWQILGVDNQAIIISSKYVKEEREALKNYLNVVFEEEKEWNITERCLQLLGRGEIVIAEKDIRSKTEGELFIERANQFLDEEIIKSNYIKESGIAYGLELRNAAQKVLLESVVLYENRNLIEILKASLAADRYEKIKVDATQYRLDYKDEKGSTIAKSREVSNQPDDLVQQIKLNFEQLEIVEFSNTYTFKILDNDKAEELVEGFVKYASPAQAFIALFDFLEQFKSEKLSFRPIEDTEIQLADIELYIVDELGKFIGFSPKENFGKPEYWENEVKVIRTLLAEMKIPLEFVSESKFYLSDHSGKEILRSSQYFTKPNSALTAGKKAIAHISQQEEFDKHIIYAKDRQSLLLVIDEHLPSLTFSTTGDRVELEDKLLSFQENILQSTYTVGTASIPVMWKYRYYWIDQEETAQILYESETEYNDRNTAVEIYKTILASEGKINTTNIDDTDELGFAISIEGQKLVHAKKYETKRDRTQAIRHLKSGIEFFKNLQPDESCVFPTERSTNEENFVYRLLRKGNPIAFHPCECYDLNDEKFNFLFKNRLTKLCERQYNFPTFYQKGNLILCLQDDKWHYLLRNKKTNDKIYFTSKEGFNSRLEAIEAFEEIFLKLIYLASDIENYQIETLDDGTDIFYLGTSYEMAQVTMQKTIFSERENMANWFFSFPIRIKGKNLGEKCFDNIIHGYYFHLAGSESDCDTDWLSTRCYDTEDEARKAFKHFLNLLKNKVNYRPQLNAYIHDWRQEYVEEKLPPKLWEKDKDPAQKEVAIPETKPCCHYITITEVLAESCVGYENEACAWGEYILKGTFSGLEFTTLEDACKTFRELSIRSIQTKIGKDTIKCKPTDKAGKNAYFFELLVNAFHNNKSMSLKYIGEQLYESNEEAESAAVRFIRNGIEMSDLKLIYDDDCLYRIAHLVHIEETQKLELPCHDEIDNCLTESKGLERFLKAVCDEEAFVPCMLKSKDVLFTFKIVEPEKYYLAKHPYQFHTADDRDKMTKWIFDQLKKKDWFFEVVPNDKGKNVLRLCVSINKTVKDEELVHYVNAPNEFQAFNLKWEIDLEGQQRKFCLLEIDRSFTEEEKSTGKIDEYKECIEANINILVSNFDHFAPTGDFKNEDLGIALINPNGILALHPQSYDCEEDLWTAIEATKNHIHTEGMHLVEHILLRPEKIVSENNEQEFDCGCVLLATPQLECKLPLPFDESDPCREKPDLSNDIDREQGNDSPTYIPGADSYSFIASTVLPYWSKRYKDENFKRFISNTLLRETPAHITLNTLWLSPKQLCKFEDAYWQWRRHKSELELCDADMPCDLIECLSSLRNYCPTPTDDDTHECDCDTATTNFNIQSLSLNRLFNNSRNFVSPLLKTNLTYFPVFDNQLNFTLDRFKNLLTDVSTIINIGDGLDILDTATPVAPSRILETAEKKIVKKSPKETKKVNKILATPKKTIKKSKQSTTPLSAKGIKKPKSKNLKKKLDKKSPTNKVSKKKAVKVKSIKKESIKKENIERPFYNNIKTLNDKNVLASKTYQNTLSFAEKIKTKKISGPLLKELSEKVIGYNLRYAYGKQGGGNDKVYLGLIADALALCLDKLVAQNNEKIIHQKAINELLTKIRNKGIKLSVMKKHWNTKALRAKTRDAAAIDLYLQLFE